jgi:hypothetical protein
LPLPVVFGVMIEVACDLLRYVVRYFSTSIYFEVKLGLWEQLKDLDLWIGFAFAVVLVALSTWVLDAWKFGMAMAAMIKIMATTISNSISEKPFCLRISIFLPVIHTWEDTNMKSLSIHILASGPQCERSHSEQPT